MLNKYLVFIRRRDVAGMTLIACLSRMPIGMLGLATLLMLRDRLGSYTLAGTAVGIYYVAMALCAPIQGRIIDRAGPRRPLLVTGIVQPLALIALFTAAYWRLPFAAIVICALLAGAFQPPITVLTRTLWRYRFAHDDDRRMAFAVDSVLIEFNFTVGPALVAFLVAYFGTLTAFAASIVVVVVALLLFMRSPGLRYWKHQPPAERHLLGPLTDPLLVSVFVISFGTTFCFGLLEVGYPGFATALGAAALGGILLSINSAGSALGGAIYGGLHLRMPVERQFAATLAIMAAPFFLHAWIDQPAVFAVVAFFAGVAIAPTFAAQALLVSRLAPAKYATEAFTWSSTFIVSGIGAGTAVGGILIESVSVKSVFALAGITVGAMAILALMLPSTQPAAAE